MSSQSITLQSKVSIIVLGEMAVGKTSLLLRFNKGKFSAYNASTSINRYFKDICVMNTDVQLELYDTGGHDRFRDIVKTNYHKVDGVVLVYDVTDVTSFYKLSSWLDEMRSANEKAPVIIVGNKSDTADTKTVSRMMVKSYAVKENLEYYESSAKTGENVYQIFERITQKVLEAKNGISSSILPTESYNFVHPSQSTDLVVINPSPQPTNNRSELTQPIEESARNPCTPTQSLETSSTHSDQPDSSAIEPDPASNEQEDPASNEQEDPASNEQEDPEESEWCFPDLEYLNSRNRIAVRSSSKDDLPPIVKLSDDIIKLHIEKCTNNVKRRSGEMMGSSCC